MARQKGIIKIEGSIDELSFYSSVYGDIVRRKGGASKTKIKKHPNFKRLREHHDEFSNCAKAGKLLRQALKPFTLMAPDHTLVWRVTRLMNQVKDLDAISVRGQRNVAEGLRTAEGKKLLEEFTFNDKAALKQVLKRPVKAGDGKLSISGFVPKRDLNAPKGATHVSVGGIVSQLDFKASTHVFEIKSLTLKLDKVEQDLILKPVSGKSGTVTLYLLQLQFLQEVNGALHELANKEGNVLEIVKVE